MKTHAERKRIKHFQINSDKLPPSILMLLWTLGYLWHLTPLFSSLQWNSIHSMDPEGDIQDKMWLEHPQYNCFVVVVHCGWSECAFLTLFPWTKLDPVRNKIKKRQNFVSREISQWCFFFNLTSKLLFFIFNYLQQVFARSYADSVSEAVGGGGVMAPGYVVESRCVFNLNV